ncbi:hypothetical protein [Methanohalobium sp.]|uniref:hypothetical protein n=1 Tax=Methanohalobium sp. TaxID=2837493 RepID=UPI0025D22264|nr:hypothetical protein [Methanohalobium sp.]
MRGNRSKDFPDLTIDQIKQAVKYWRAVLIRQDQQRNFNRYRMFEQDLGLVNVDQFDTAESNSVDSMVTITRTENRIPAPLRLKEWEGITHVGEIDKTGQPIPVVDAQRSYWNQYNKYTGNDREAFYRDGYVYVKNDKTLDQINIRGIFEDPEEVYDYKGIDENSPFPVPEDMEQRIVQSLLNGELGFAVQMQGAQTQQQQE